MVVARPGKARRVTATVLLVLAAVITLAAALTAFGAWQNDRAITGHLGRANAEVVSASFTRAIVRFETPDGTQHNPKNGVLYPQGLHAGDWVRVEYDERAPDLVRVAERSVKLTLLPLGSTVLFLWLAVVPIVWLLRRPPRLVD